MTTESVFQDVDKQADGLSTRTSWRGVLSIESTSLGFVTNTEYHLIAGKAKGTAEAIKKKLIDRQTGREVVRKEVSRMYSHTEGAEDYRRLTYDEAKAGVRYNGLMVTAKQERAAFDKEQLEVKGIWEEIPEDRVAMIQEGQEGEISGFERTRKIVADESSIVPLSRIPKYLLKSIYMLNADDDKKVKESPRRVRDLARLLLDKNSAMACFFSFGRDSTTYYTAVIYPYEDRETGKTYLLMSMTEGLLNLDQGWSLDMDEVAEPEPQLQAVAVSSNKRKPVVSISK